MRLVVGGATPPTLTIKLAIRRLMTTDFTTLTKWRGTFIPNPHRGAIVNNVNKADDGFVNVTRSSSRSVVPTAAVLAAELLKRTTPPSVVGVPKCRKKL